MREWGYRLKEDGEVESRLFEDGRNEGWEDSPAKCTATPPKKRGRPKKAAE